MNKRLMIVGSGDLASKTAQLMSLRCPSVELLIVGRDDDRTVRVGNLARLAARQVGLETRIATRRVASLESEQFVAAIQEFSPEVIYLAVSEQPWHLLDAMPAKIRHPVYDLGFGPWLPVHLAPVAEAMSSIRDSGSTAIVVNAAFPDAVNPVLVRSGSGPHLGIGNVANCVPGLTESAAQVLGVDSTQVKVRLICHHYVSHRIGRHGDSNDAPFGLRVECNDEDVTERIGVDNLLRLLAAEQRRVGGRDGQWMTAASAARVLSMVLGQGAETAHAPGVHGRIGGYPIKRLRDRVVIDLGDFVSEDEARRLNENGQVWDGIERIDANGTVWFTDRVVTGMRENLRYDCASLVLAEAKERSRELRARFAEFRARVAVTS